MDGRLARRRRRLPGVRLGPERLAVYQVTGAIRRPDALHATKLLFPSCLRWMPYAEPVLDLEEISEARRAKLASRIRTRDSLLGPDDG